MIVYRVVALVAHQQVQVFNGRVAPIRRRRGSESGGPWFSAGEACGHFSELVKRTHGGGKKRKQTRELNDLAAGSVIGDKKAKIYPKKLQHGILESTVEMPWQLFLV